MSDQTKTSLKLDEKLRAEEAMYASMFHRGENKILYTAFAVAILIHVIVIFVHFPTFKQAPIQKKERPVVVIRKYVPPPPKVEQKQIVRRKFTRKVPIPDPTPDEPEPIREPEPEVEPEPLPPDAEVIIGEPEAPPPSGPLVAGVGGVTVPELILESKAEPVYPELARKARIEANVILQAIISADGTVGDIQVLRCNRPGLGFEDAAIQAVSQWRYKPGRQNGRPVDVYLTVKVDFVLQ